MDIPHKDDWVARWQIPTYHREHRGYRLLVKDGGPASICLYDEADVKKWFWQAISIAESEAAMGKWRERIARQKARKVLFFSPPPYVEGPYGEAPTREEAMAAAVEAADKEANNG